MSLLFIDGFDHYTTADLTKKWTTVDTAVTVGATIGRRGGGAMRALSSGNGIKKVIKASTTVIAAMAYRPEVTVSAGNGCVIFYDLNDVIHARVTINADGSLSAQRGSGSATLATSAGGLITLDTWAFIEVKVVLSDTVGAMAVRVNGVEVINVSGVDTRNAGAAAISIVKLSNGGGYATIDDVHICDGLGTTNNDFLGDCRVDTLYPNAEGTYSEFSLGAGAGDPLSWVLSGATYMTAATGTGAVGSGYSFSSANQGINNSSARYTLTNTGGQSTLSGTYSVSSEPTNDVMRIYVNGAVRISESGTKTGVSFSIPLYSGDVVDFYYIKDSVSASGSDSATWSNVVVGPMGGHFTRVDETTPDLLEYVSSSVVGARDSYAMTNLPALVSQVVYGVQSNLYVQRSDSGSRTAASILLSSGAQSQGATLGLPTWGPKYFTDIYETNPNGGTALTESVVNALQLGVKVVS